MLGENNRMLSVFARAASACERSLADGVFHVTFPTEETAEHSAVTERRDPHGGGARASRPILQPRAVAVVGASRDAGSIGAARARQPAVAAGFTGPIHPVNPHADRIAGLPVPSDGRGDR